MKSIFICDYCGKQFENDSFRCQIHEESCDQNPLHWILIRVTCNSAIKNCHSYISSECKSDTCINRVLVPIKMKESVKQNEPYDYTDEYRSDGFRSGYRAYTSTKNPEFTFTAKYGY